MAEELSFKIEKLTAENYHSWKFKMKMYLMGKDLWEVVTGTEFRQNDWTEAEKRKFKKRENQALAAICLGISTNLQIYVRSSETPKSAWDNLEKHFQQKTLSKKMIYRRKLYSAQMEKGQSMTEHVNYIKTFGEHLEAIDDAIAEKDLVILLISSLSDDYNYLITALEIIADDNLAWDYVRDRLIHESEKKCVKTNATDALLSRIDKKTLKCHYCKKTGHFARDCYKKKNDLKKKGDQAKLVRDESPTIPNGGAEIALKSSNPIADKNWWIDSGASQHMTHQRESIEKFSSFENPHKIRLADDSVLISYGKGDVRLIVKDKTENVKLILKDVLFVPKIQNKLFSLPAITEKGVTVDFDGESCGITIEGKRYHIGTKHGKLYRLNTFDSSETCCIAKTNPKKNVDVELWHQRYGHLGYDNLKLLTKKELVNGMVFDAKENIDRNCDGCAMGKQHRQPFPKTSKSSTSKLLELIHSDVCGPMDVPSVGGSRYFVTFIGDYSRYTTVYMMKQKSEVLDKFKEFVNLVENRTGLKVQRLNIEYQTVKRLRSNNGGEYFSNDFDTFCTDRGIQRGPTIPYSPQQNGVAERMNRTLLEAARSMLHHAKKPIAFWAEAIAIACYLRNRSPTSSLKDGTPYEHWYGEKPDVSNLKVFGCKAYVHVPDVKRKGKFEKKSFLCVFVGYPSKENGFKFYNPQTRQMFRSRDVIFVEKNFDVEKIEEDEPNSRFFTDRIESESITENDPEQPKTVNENVAARPARARRPADRLNVLTGEWWNLTDISSIAIFEETEPTTMEEALSGPNSELWKQAIQSEYDSSKSNGAWYLVDMPANKNLVGSKWVFKHKRGADGKIRQCKTRLVTQGYSQKSGIDYNDVFAPVAKYNSIRPVLVITNELD